MENPSDSLRSWFTLDPNGWTVKYLGQYATFEDACARTDITLTLGDLETLLSLSFQVNRILSQPMTPIEALMLETIVEASIDTTWWENEHVNMLVKRGLNLGWIKRRGAALEWTREGSNLSTLAKAAVTPKE